MMSGKHISHYELAEKLGEGGMGVVYKAWDLTLGRPVALKFLPGHMADSPEQVTRFHQEARAISAVNHPNIATIYEIGEAEGQCFLALEYLSGGTLEAALQQLKAAGQPLSLEQALDYAVQIAEALAHAHAHGVIHRDIKTANMLFTESRSLKITDFGLAKLAEGSSVTRTGTVMGTPATMSPEQAQGLEVDERTDIFSAGVVMFELFTSQRPFRGANPTAMLYQVVHVPAPPLGESRLGTPAALERIVAKALEKDRAARYQKAADLAADLRSLRRELITGSFTGRSVQETVAMTAAPGRKRRWLAAGLPAAFIVAGMGAWIGWPAVRDRVTSTLSGLHARSLPAEKRLAVLPFRNVGGNPKDQAFVDGLREVVIGKLTRLERPGGSLVVVVSPDELQAKEINTAADAWKRLGANLVMTGSVIQAGQQPQLIVNLEDPQSLTVLRSETVDASHPDLAVEATRLVGMLELQMSSASRETLRAGDSSDPAAIRFYIEGRGYLLRYDRVENLDLAAGAFRDAVAKDPNYALAWAGWAEALRWKHWLQKEPALLAQAAAHAAHALQLNSRPAALHVTMGQIRLQEGNREAAARELQTALALEPANAGAFQALGDVYESTQRYEEAEKTYRKAIEMRPGDPSGRLRLGFFYYNRERLPEAELEFRRALELAPDSPRAHSNLGVVYLRKEQYSDAVEQFEKSVSIEPNARGYSNLGAAYYYLKRYADSVQPFRRAVEMARTNSMYWGNLADAYRWTPDLSNQAPGAFRHAIELLEQEVQVDPRNPRLRARLGMYYASIQERPRALGEMAEALRLDPSQAYVQYRAALVYEQLGDHDQALKALELALKAGQPMAEIRTSPVLEQLRKDARFVRMASPQP
jgi:tetratricopeptide (TPR) repeat protein/TolB-like protein